MIATKIGWHPIEFINNVSSTEVFLSIAAKSGANVEGAISTDYVLDPNNADQATLPGAKLAKQILDLYGGQAPIFNLNNIYGLASGWTMVQALKAAGNPPTRAGLMKALTSLNTRTIRSSTGDRGEDVADRLVPGRAAGARPLPQRRGGRARLRAAVRPALQQRALARSRAD